MKNNNALNFIKDVLENMPTDWLKLTTHRLDIYNEKLAKVEFLEQFEILYNELNSKPSALNELPTAYDYIRLGHPLSCVLEWTIASLHGIRANNVITFSSKTIAILAILRKNLLDGKKTQIIHTGELPEFFDIDVLRNVYGYTFDVKQVEQESVIPRFTGSTIFISKQSRIDNFDLNPNIDFFITVQQQLGSILLINGKKNKNYISAIQHVRRRETIAMTPADSLTALNLLIEPATLNIKKEDIEISKKFVLDSITAITGSQTKVLIGSSGLSTQYAIVMGLIHDALEQHKGKTIKIIVPTNCYGGTNDQARRVAVCIDKVEFVDLAIDDDNNMVQSIDTVLEKIALEDAIPYIIAEIPTNPRVEVPDLIKLKDVLRKERKTSKGEIAVDPVFILDQTFCPNVNFLGKDEVFSKIRTIAYVSGSKFPSGGLCTAGYCIGNSKTEALIEKIETHLKICDNEATNLQVETLAKQLPSMNQRIHDAYKNTREFVTFIQNTLPEAKINFVSEALAKHGFTPSVFSLDLPTKGKTHEDREAYKRALNHTLIKVMIQEIPNESKFCVSYGQLNGCYWTIPATSTQGTTKEGDKDYIVRVSLSPNMNIELHKQVFLDFVRGI